MQPKLNVTWSVRMSDEQRRRFKRAADAMNMPHAWIMNALIEAFCEQVELQGEVTFPLAVVSKSVWIRRMKAEQRKTLKESKAE